MAEQQLWLSNIVETALDQGRDVEIEEAEDYGFHIVIDGVPVTESPDQERDEGLPWEGLEYPLIQRRTYSRDRKPSGRALEKAREIVGDSQ